MTDKTKIEWADATWNPVTGCTKVSEGCDHCYAATIAHRFAGTRAYPNGFEVTLRPERLDQPLRWKRPRRIFVNSMSDLFHKDVPDEYIARVFAVMALAQQHTFQVLTKRPGRMRSFVQDNCRCGRHGAMAHLRSAMMWAVSQANADRIPGVPDDAEQRIQRAEWPLPNVWLGTSVESQKWADVRIPQLLATPAVVRFLSCEPLLGPVELRSLLPWQETGEAHQTHPDWVIVGGESGPKARPMHPEWARSLRDQCTAAGVAFHFKQWGEWVTEDQSPEDITLPGMSREYFGEDFYKVGKRAAGRELGGRTWDEYPAA